MTVSLLATDYTISLHRACYNFTSLFISCYPMGLWVDTPAVPAHFFINLLLKASLAHFPHLYLFWALLPNIPTMPTHFTTSSLRLPRPIYSFFTSFTLMGFLLDSLGFLGPITTNLPVITFQAYWPLSQPNEFTNSFPRLPQPINLLLFPWAYYSIPWASSAHLLLLYLFLFLWACWPSILPFQPIRLVFLFLNLFPLLTFSIVVLLLLLDPLSKMGINRQFLASFFTSTFIQRDYR